MPKHDIRIYVAGPLSIGNREKNVNNAIDVGNQLFGMGLLPYIPHLTHYWNLLHPRRWEDWITLDLSFLELCQGLFRIKGDSRGADIEENYAKQLKIPIFYSMDELEKYDWGKPNVS